MSEPMNVVVSTKYGQGKNGQPKDYSQDADPKNIIGVALFPPNWSPFSIPQRIQRTVEQKKTHDEAATRSDPEGGVFCGLWIHRHNAPKPHEKQQGTSTDPFLERSAFGIHDS
jgi:hypothetical protein